MQISPDCFVRDEDITRWDRRFFQLTNTIAGWSEDQSRKVGCVIAGVENGILSTGYNGFPREVLDQNDRHSSIDGEKYYWFEHAERNAIYNAVRTGTALLNSRLYVNLFPCADCTRAVIQSGVKELNTFAPDPNEKFFLRSFEVSIAMLSEASVRLRLFPANVAS
jgi:dCMP deaminase